MYGSDYMISDEVWDIFSNIIFGKFKKINEIQVHGLIKQLPTEVLYTSAAPDMFICYIVSVNGSLMFSRWFYNDSMQVCQHVMLHVHTSLCAPCMWTDRWSANQFFSCEIKGQSKWKHASDDEMDTNLACHPLHR